MLCFESIKVCDSIEIRIVDQGILELQVLDHSSQFSISRNKVALEESGAGVINSHPVTNRNT